MRTIENSISTSQGMALKIKRTSSRASCDSLCCTGVGAVSVSAATLQLCLICALRLLSGAEPELVLGNALRRTTDKAAAPVATILQLATCHHLPSRNPTLQQCHWRPPLALRLVGSRTPSMLLYNSYTTA